MRQELDLQPFDRFDVEVVTKEIRLRKRLLDLWELEGIVPALDPPMDPDAAIRIAKLERAKQLRMGDLLAAVEVGASEPQRGPVR